ncbi:MAG: type I-F CRISPR-associated endoribonuclease Cas6/Csy4 [Castellaniella sp.]
MSTHYIDVRLLPDPDFSQAHLLGALYAKFHRALVELGTHEIGVSFPQYSMQPRTLGSVLRVHGGDDALNALLSTGWLRGMRDHVELGVLSAVPQAVQHRHLLRRQFKTSVDRLRHRRMRRKGETYEQAVQAIPDGVERQPDLPFVQLRSASTGQRFCLFLALGDPEPQSVAGEFNAYGLSSTATLPWF